jgi:signal transduction histidine kinase
LALLTLAGVGGLSVVRQIQTRNQDIREDYVRRDRILEQLRSDIYLSGTYVRDFLLEANDSMAEAHRVNFEKTRRMIEASVAEYRKLLRPEEIDPFNHLADELSAYFNALKPALTWQAPERRSRGYVFMRDEVLPRRTTMISLANQVSKVNEHQLGKGNLLLAQLFGQFRLRMVLMLALTVGVGIVLAAISMYRILQLERESQLRYREIVDAQRELQELSARLVNAQEEERRAISRELHDEVGQSLSALLLNAGNLAKALPAAPDDALQEQLRSIRRLAEKTVAVVRNMSLLLRPSMLDDLGLAPALQWQAREVSRTTGLRVNVAAEVSDDLPEEHKTCVYRVVQEALRNCYRHAKAQSVRIHVKQEPTRLFLSIQDDGSGFQPGRDKGLGLLGMEERVKHLGGVFHVVSEEGAGALLSVELPLSVDSSPEATIGRQPIDEGATPEIVVKA